LALAETDLRQAHEQLLSEHRDLLENQNLHRRCLEILAMAELEGLQELLLRTFSEIADSRGAALWVRNRRGSLVLRAYRGTIDRERLPLQIDPRNGPLAARIESTVPFLAPAVLTGQGPIVPALHIPLGTSGQIVGLCVLTDRASPPPTGAEIARVQVVAEFAAVALRNARRLHELERGGLRDRDTQAYNLSYFIDYAGKELYKASRYGRQFSIITLSIDNLALLRRRLVTGALAETNRRLVKALSSLVRDSDVLSKVGEGEFYFLLPETDRFGAMMFERRVVAAARALDEDSTDERPPLSIVLGSATFPRDGDDFDELLHLCRHRMDEARQTLRRKLHLEDLGFWPSVDALFGAWDAGRTGESHGVEILPSYRGLLPETHFASVQREVGRELSRDPRARGLLYVGVGELNDDPPFLATLPPGEIATRVYFLGRRGTEPIGHPAVTTVFAKSGGPDVEQALQRHDFILFLAERAAYALLKRRGPEAACFHTSDRPLVDHLVAQLQEDYDLQPY
jgi:diguanylate cyclase (GGDEF)-like protein